MDKIFEIDWQTMWEPSSSLMEMIVRGSITYWAIFLLLRFFRRGAGQLGISDVLLIILIADASQNSMAGEYKSVSEGVVLIATLVFWDLAIDWLSYHSDAFNSFAQPKESLLIKNGMMQKNNLRRQLITEDDLKGILREQGIDDISQVKSCCLEGSGNISVIRKQDAGQLPKKPEKAV
jgi:uncharacterized membrane protein YcaP (DUF421 family)